MKRVPKILRRRKKSSRKTDVRKAFRFTILFLVLVACVTAGIYFSPNVFLRENKSPSKSPPFEIYSSENFEVRLKHLDRALYTSLVALGVSVDDVEFPAVYTQYSKNLHWSFAVLEIRPSHFPSQANIRSTLDRHVSGKVSGATFQIASDNDNPVVHVSLDQHPTHRLVFLKTSKTVPPLPPVLKPLPKVSIILDDVGYDKKIAMAFLSLEAPITVSIFPFSPHRKTIAAMAWTKGRDVMLHLPMEPQEYPEVNPGEGVLLTSMDRDALLAQLEEDLQAIPYIVGVNNHMGSKFTKDPERMTYVFDRLKEKGLFFVDSRTTTRTCAKRVARRINLRFAERQVFLDHLEEASFIQAQIKQLVTIARSRGAAIGIIHPHRMTYRIIKEALPGLKKVVEIVPVSQLIN